MNLEVYVKSWKNKLRYIVPPLVCIFTKYFKFWNSSVSSSFTLKFDFLERNYKLMLVIFLSKNFVWNKGKPFSIKFTFLGIAFEQKHNCEKLAIFKNVWVQNVEKCVSKKWEFDILKIEVVRVSDSISVIFKMCAWV